MKNLNDRLANLTPEQLALLQKKLAKRKGKTERIGKRPNLQEYPMSFAQERLWFLQQLDPQSPFYNMPMAIAIKGKINIPLFKQALSMLLERHEILRSYYIANEKGSPIQKIAALDKLPFMIHTEKNLHNAQELIQKLVFKCFDLETPPLVEFHLIKIKSMFNIFLINLHHINADGWSVNIMVDEIVRLYSELSKCQKPATQPIELQYADYAWWQRQIINSPKIKNQLDYWKNYLKGMPQVLEFVTDFPRSPIQSHTGKQIERHITKGLYKKLLQTAKSLDISPFSLLLATTQLFLFKITRQTDFGVGIPLANRQRKEFEKVVGFFVNTGVIRAQIDPKMRFSYFSKNVHEDVLNATDNQDIPFEQVVEALQPDHDLSHAPLFQVMFDLQKSPFSKLQLNGLELEPFDIHINIAKFDLLFLLIDYEDYLKITLEYNSDIFAEETVDRWLDYYLYLFKEIQASPQKQIKDLKLIPLEEEQKIINWALQFNTPYPNEKSVVDLFEEQVRIRPNAIALSFQNKSYTYQQLNSLANKIGRYLISKYPTSQSLIGIYMTKSPLMIATILAIIKYGKGYLALDPKFPIKRIELIINETQTDLIITDSKMRQKLPPKPARILDVDDEWPAIEKQLDSNLGIPVSPDDIIYVMFTSGSTGIPKGVSIPHRGVIRLVFNQSYATFGPQETLGFLASIAFDASTFEIWGALLHGARLAIFPHLTPSLGELAKFIEKEKISLQVLTTGLFHLMVDEQLHALLKIKQLLAGGDVLSPAHVKKFIEHMPNGHIFIPVYGPTENTTFTTTLKMNDFSSIRSTIPIGIPINNSEVYILDDFLNLVPQGVPGELYAAGDGVALHYFNKADLTAERFLPNPFSKRAGSRMYRTGDLVRQRMDGIIEFIGRIDTQVKIRGFRIELSEIEKVLSTHHAIKNVVVTTFEEKPGDKLLVAYLIKEPDKKISSAELKEYLSEQLPSYMVPNAFVFLETFPLNISGKVDRGALPRPQLREAAAIKEFVPPNNQLEKYLCKIWEDVLGVPQVGITDNFFDLGGNSLKAAIFINYLQRDFKHEIPVAAVFKAPTIKKLAAYMLEYFEDDISKKFHIEKKEQLLKIRIEDNKKITSADVRKFRNIINPLSDFPERPSGKNPKAVFVLSPPRSGSTLFRIMLAGNPKLFSPPELDLLSFNTLKERRETFTKHNLELWLEAPIKTFMELKNYDFNSAAHLMRKFEDQNMSIKEFYGYIQNLLKDRMLVDKTPTYPLDIKILQRAEEDFNNPYYIHLVRHPYAMIYSFLEAKLDQSFFRYKHSFSRRVLAELIWIVSNQNILQFFNNVPPERIFRIRFEDLLLNPENELRKVCKFLNVDFDEEMLKPYHGNKMTEPARPQSQMVGDFKFYLHRGIDPKVAERWKRYHTVDFLSDMAWELAEKFSYQVEKNLSKHLKKEKFQIIPRKRPEYLPLSYAQQRLWFLEQLEPGRANYNIPSAIRMHGKIDISGLMVAIKQLIKRHESLRTVFHSENGRAYQVIKNELDIPIQYISLMDIPADQRFQKAISILKEEAKQPFNLSKGPLLRIKLIKLGDDDHLLMLNMHHIISDGWSVGIIIRDLTEIYKSIIEKRAAQLPPLPVTYVDFALWQREYLSGTKLKVELKYWEEQFKDAPRLIELPLDHPRPAIQSFNGRRIFFELTEDLSVKIKRLARELDVTPFMFLMASFQILLHRYARQETILVGTPVANRNLKEIENLVGFFVNTLVIRGDFYDEPAFTSFLQQIRQRITEAFEHQELPFEKIVDHLKIERTLSHNPLFQVMFAYQPPLLKSIKIAGVEFKPLELETEIAKFDLTVSMAENNGHFSGVWEFNTDLWEQATIERMITHFKQLLLAIIENPNQKISQLALMNPDEIRHIIEDFNAIAPIDYPQDALLHRLFEQQVLRTPDNIALVYKGQTMTYRELNQRANQLANFLIKKGVKPEQFIGISVERNFDLMVAIFGILKAGAAFVPLDPSYPLDRLKYMAEDSGLSYILTQNQYLELLKTISAPKIALDSDWQEISKESMDNPTIPIHSQNLCYVIYTSGSTGQPKGVQVQHNTVIILIHDYIKKFELTPDKRLLQYFSYSFDASIGDIFMVLFTGASLYLVGKDEMMPDSGLIALIRDQRITNAVLPPSLLSVLPAEAFPDLTMLASGGDVCPPELARKWATPNRKYYNAYGPTETTVCASWYLTNNLPKNATNVPIGMPIPHYRIYILDEHYNPLPVGVPGQIFIAGKGITRGYLNKPDLTAEKFIPDPYAKESGARMYASGDLARYLPDGNIEFLGRIDQQVKIRGFRIELGEIEASLLDHKAIKEAIVLAKGLPGEKQLVAYIVLEQDRKLTIGELRNFLQKRLPDYMIPAYFVFLDKLPVAATGKIDRKRLPEPTLSREALQNAYMAPKNKKEEILANIWKELLNLPQIGIKDNFFELGGDSILSIQVVARANRAGLKITPRQLFENPTIEALAAIAEEGVAIKAQQGLISGLFPITPIQHYFFSKKLANPHHWNQSLMLQLEKPLNLDLLESVFQQLYRHHDVLRTHFIESDGSMQALISDKVPENILDIKTLTAHSKAELDEQLYKTTNEVQASLNVSQGPLVRAAYFKTNENFPDFLLLVIHHLIVDVVSWRILSEDLISLYKQLSEGSSSHLPPKTTSFKYWAERIAAYADSDTIQAERNYWSALADIHLPPLPKDKQGENIEAKAQTIRVSLTPEETEALLKEAPAAYHTQINELLLTALVRAARLWYGQDNLIIDMEGHGREDIFEDVDLSRTVGWFTTTFPVHLNLKGITEPGKSIMAIKEQYRKIPNNGIGYGLLTYLSKKPLAKPIPTEIGFNYLGQFKNDAFKKMQLGKPIPVPGFERDPKNERFHALEIGGSIIDDILNITFSYSKEQFLKETIQDWADKYLNELRILIRHCQQPDAGAYTPSDFKDVDLNEDDLDDLFDELDLD